MRLDVTADSSTPQPGGMCCKLRELCQLWCFLPFVGSEGGVGACLRCPSRPRRSFTRSNRPRWARAGRKDRPARKGGGVGGGEARGGGVGVQGGLRCARVGAGHSSPRTGDIAGGSPPWAPKDRPLCQGPWRLLLGPFQKTFVKGRVFV